MMSTLVRSMPPTMTEVPSRTCPHCGFEERSERERCSRCGRSVLVRAPRLRGRRRTQVIWGGAAVGGSSRSRPSPSCSTPSSPTATTASAATRPRPTPPSACAYAPAGAPPRRAPRSWRRPRAPPTPTACAARAALVRAAEASITRDAQGRARSGELRARSRGTECGPLLKAKAAVPDDRILSKAIGRYDCVAVTHSVNGESGQSVGRLGFPFVAALDFKSSPTSGVATRPARASAASRWPSCAWTARAWRPRAGARHGLRGRPRQLGPPPRRLGVIRGMSIGLDSVVLLAAAGRGPAAASPSASTPARPGAGVHG